MSTDFDTDFPGDDGQPQGPTEAEQAVHDFLQKHPMGSAGFKEQEAEYNRLVAEAYPDDAESGEESAEPQLPAYQENSPEAVLAATPEGQDLLREWGDEKNITDNVAIAKEQAVWLEQNNPALAAWAAEQHEAGSDVMSNPAVIQWLVQQGRERMYGPTGGDNAPAKSQPPARQNRDDRLPMAPDKAMDAQERLDELYGMIGTPEYKHSRVQNEIRELEAALDGDGPIVGSQQRYA